jgi:hypothetical protein
VAPIDGSTTIIVSGLPRCGTSLMMRMLQAGGVPLLTDGLRAADEDNPGGYFEYEPVRRTRQDASWIEQARGRAVKVVHVLLPHLPADRAYRVILMARDLCEVVASQRAMLQRRGAQGAALPPQQLAEAYRRQLRNVAAWLAGRPNMRVLDVDYHDLVRDPAAGAAAVGRFLGVDLDTVAMAACVDPFLHRQRAELTAECTTETGRARGAAEAGK